MKKFYIPIAAFVSALSLFLIFNSCNSAHKTDFFGDAATIGSGKNTSARADYEWMMLHDPATGKIPAHIRERELEFAESLPSDGDLNLSFGKTSVANWQSRGPWNVGGRTRAFALDISNENNLIAGSTSGGMWRSTDGGTSWSPTSTPSQHKSVSCLAQDTRSGHTNIWYYGTGEAYGASAGTTGAYYLGNGVYKSTDGGASWNVLASTTNANITGFDLWGDLIWNVVTDPADTIKDVVYAAAYGGIYKSIDGGGNWTLVKGSFSGQVSYFTDIAISKTGVIYVSLSADGSQKGLFRSSDGNTFTDITPVNFPTTYNRVKIGISPSDEEQVYFLGNTPGFGQPDTNFQGDVEWNSLWKYTYVSGDGSDTGGIWNDRSVNLPTTGGPFDKFSAQGSYNLVVKVKPDDPNTVFIGGTNLYRSTTGFADDQNTAFIGGYKQGATLPKVEMYANHHPDQHEIVFFPGNSTRMISANDGGIFRTENNAAANVTWTPLNNGYLTSMFYTCAIDHATSDNIVIGGSQDNGSWYTNSAISTDPWITPRGGDGSYCAIADNGSAFYYSIQNGKMMRAKVNAAGAIDSFARIDPRDGKGYLFINPYTLDPNNNKLMYLAGGKYLWRNNDLSGIPYAGNWDSITTNWTRWPDSVYTTNAKISAVAVAKTPANRVYYGTTSKRVFRIDNANTGTPAPVDITSASMFPTANVSCIAVDPNDGNKLMVVFSNYNVYSLFYSDNAGLSWSRVGGNLEANLSGFGNGPSLRWARIMPVNGGTVYMLATSVGLFATTQLNGTSTRWTQQGKDEIGNSVITMIDHRSTDGLVVVATHSHGLFSARITGLGDVASVEDFTGASASLTAFPNPFASETAIQFTLSSKGRVSLKIYDCTGKLIRVMADEEMPAGVKNFTFSGSGLRPGIYYCHLQSGTFRETKKFLLSR